MLCKWKSWVEVREAGKSKGSSFQHTSSSLKFHLIMPPVRKVKV